MSKIEDGWPAFPVHDPFSAHQPSNVDEAKRLAGGMTLRDYFAAKAMQGMLACEMLRATEQEFSERAYAIADAMLRARNQS